MSEFKNIKEFIERRFNAMPIFQLEEMAINEINEKVEKLIEIYEVKFSLFEVAELKQRARELVFKIIK